MPDDRLVRTSKLLSKILRHDPGSVVLVVDAAGMHRDGHVFFRSENGVWLTAHVPPGYLRRVDGRQTGQDPPPRQRGRE